ncbi:hypothetical protein NPIL_338301 [Nephila pilipes]|uniref:Uncharacterized protein n=1 Tax=Nephila pilipes TaxID=299642 RepID=A0A8X6U9G3_NEPPI|nr:hypothetical protein NPIL_338301 [Nephila pilipes]
MYRILHCRRRLWSGMGEEGEVCKQCIPLKAPGSQSGRAWPIEHSPSPIGYGTPPLRFRSSLPVSNTSRRPLLRNERRITGVLTVRFIEDSIEQ